MTDPPRPIWPTGEARELEERQHWPRFYAERLTAQLDQVTAVARQRRAHPDRIRRHFSSFLSLLNACDAHAPLDPLWLELVDALHPLPLWWGQWASWLAVLRRAAAKAETLGKAARQADYLAHAAALLEDTGASELALRAGREALRLARQVGDAPRTALAAALVSSSLRNSGRAHDALRLLEEVEGITGVLDDRLPLSRETALLTLERLDLHRHFGRLPEAVELGERLVVGLDHSPDLDDHTRAVVLRRGATILWAAGRFAQAASDLRRSAELFTSVGDAFGAIFSEGNLGLVYHSMGRFDEAEASKLRAIQAGEALNANWWLVRDLGELCGIYMYTGQLERALTYCHRHVELARQLGDKQQLALARDNRGVTLMLLGRHDEARPDIQDSLRYFQDEGMFENTILATLDMVLFLRATGESEQAAALADESFSQASRLDYSVLRILTTRCLALFQPPAEQDRLLREALALAEVHERRMDVAGCLFSLAALQTDEAERGRLYGQAAAMLRDMQAEAWLAGHSPYDPPLLPLFY